MARRRRDRQRKRYALEPDRLSVHEAVHPEQAGALMDRRLEQMLENANLTVEEVAARLETATSSVDADVLLCSLALHTQLRVLGDAGEWGEDRPIVQYHLEILQAWLLRRPFIRASAPLADDFAMLVAALRDASYIDPGALARRHRGTEPTDVERRLDLVRGDTQTVGLALVGAAVVGVGAGVTRLAKRLAKRARRRNPQRTLRSSRSSG